MLNIPWNTRQQQQSRNHIKSERLTIRQDNFKKSNTLESQQMKVWDTLPIKKQQKDKSDLQLPWNSRGDTSDKLFDFSEFEVNKIKQRKQNQPQFIQEEKKFEDDEHPFYPSSPSSSSDLSYDEDMMLEHVRCFETVEEFEQNIQLDEVKHSIVNPDYKKMYASIKKKTVLLMSIAKKYIQMKDKQENSQRELDNRIKEVSNELKKEKESADTLKKIVQTERLKQRQLCEQLHQVEVAKEAKEDKCKSLCEQKRDLTHSELKELQVQEKSAIEQLQRIQQKKNQVIEKLMSQAIHSHEPPKSMCIICSDKPVDCLLQPCNHACTCYTCAQSLQICPMDRLLFTNIKKIYLS